MQKIGWLINDFINNIFFLPSLFLLVFFTCFFISMHQEVKEKKAQGHIDFIDLCFDQKTNKTKVCE